MIKKIAIIAALLFAVGTASAQTTTFYGPGGQYQGSANRMGNTTTFYGPGGQYQGSANTMGNTTTFYGSGGQYQGTANTMGSPSGRPRPLFGSFGN
jgi:hypothetical protein